jgi:hypothetical protein
MDYEKRQIKILNEIPSESEISRIISQHKVVEIYMRGNDIVEEITSI